MTPELSATGRSVLHSARCLGTVSVDRLAVAIGWETSDVESELIDLGVDGLVRREAGTFGGGWTLTDRGRLVDTEQLRQEVQATGDRAVVERAFEEFAELNPVLLDLCSAWQLRQVDGQTVINDHTDLAYDERILQGFDECLQEVSAVLLVLAGVLPRFDRYRERFALARIRVDAGEREALTDDLESVHTIWFQLHEDLLTTLGRTR